MRTGEALVPDEPCWRCQEVPAASALGVCAACLDDLQARQRRDGPLRAESAVAARPAAGPRWEPALEHAATAAALRRYRRRSVALLLAGIVLLAGSLVAADVVERRAALPVALLALSGGCLLAAAGTAACARAARMRQILTRHAWRPWPYRARTTWRGSSRYLLAIDGHPTLGRAPFQVLRLPWTSARRLRAWRFNPQGTVWLAGGPGRFMVAFLPSAEELFVVRAARGARTRRRWLRAFPAPYATGGHTATRMAAATGSDAELIFDATPELCWRCDAAPAVNELGTCAACLADLRSPAEPPG